MTDPAPTSDSSHFIAGICAAVYGEPREPPAVYDCDERVAWLDGYDAIRRPDWREEFPPAEP